MDALNAAKAAALAGGLWLDMVAPGWQQGINWDALDITSTFQCIAGQVFDGCPGFCHSGYDHVALCLSTRHADRVALGFVSPDWEPDEEGEDPGFYDDFELEHAWRMLWHPWPGYQG
jgi:hypothetical protein